MRRADADHFPRESPPRRHDRGPHRRAPWHARTAAGALAASLLLVGTVRGAPPESEAAARARLGREALAAGKPAVARRAFLDALALDPMLGAAWVDLCRLEGDDADARGAWALNAAFAVADPAGKTAKGGLAAPLVGPEMAVPLDLAAKRAALARAIGDAAGRVSGSGHGIVRRWLRAVADDVASGAAGLAAPARVAVEKAADKVKPDPAKVRAALEAVLAETKGAGAIERALRAARLLVGLAAQKRGVLGPRAPIAEGFGPRRAVEELREALAKKLGAPIPLEELKKRIPFEQKLPFEDAHADWTGPAIVTSAKGRYRVESTCGLNTTWSAAELIEGCHDRLVAWCGRDPFEGRPGLVRVCPTWAELEQEAAPFWWAVGFAAGDLLTIVSQWDTADDLAQLLAHELTHRFDAALHPGLPAWVMEGRASYVAATTPFGGAKALDERLIDFPALDEAFKLVWEDPEALSAILSGKDPEYRHNYPVGYALWTFLSQWTGKDGPPGDVRPYRGRLPALLEALARAPGASDKAFLAVLCDGQEGRAPSLEAFTRQLSAFLLGFWIQETPEWAKAFEHRSVGAKSEIPFSYPLADRSNHPMTRRRLDPPAEGAALAALAAAFLEECGRAPDALEAHALADAVDEADLPRWGRALVLEVAAGRKDAAFARRRLRARLGAHEDEPSKPEVTVLSGACLAGAAYLDAVAKAAADAHAAGRSRTARVLRAEHDRLAASFGRPVLGEVGLPPVHPLAPGLPHGDPDCPPAENALVSGLVEDRWSAQDGTVAGRWWQPTSDEVELGRKGGRAAETGLERDARFVGVFVRTNARVAGTYTVRMRVTFGTSYVEGRVVVGFSRRDRGAEVAFVAGDRAYAEGKADASAGMPQVDLSASDLREMDARTTTLERTVPFGDAQGNREGFELAIHVAGPYVRVQVDGRDALSFRRVTGDPVEGAVGFAVDRGRARFHDVRIERHRTVGPDAACRCDRFDAPLDLAVPAPYSWTSLVGRRVVGLGPSTHVRLLLWSTGLSAADPTGAGSIHEALEKVLEPFTYYRYPVDVHVAVRGEDGADGSLEVPRTFPRAEGLKLPDGRIRTHRGFPGLDAEVEHLPQTYDLGWPGWGGLFVDPQGIVRARGPHDDEKRGIRLARYLEGW